MTDAYTVTAAATVVFNPSYVGVRSLPAATRCWFFAVFSAMATVTAIILFGRSSGASIGTPSAQ